MAILLSQVAGAAEQGITYAWTNGTALIQRDEVVTSARHVNNVMQQYFPTLFGTAIVISLFTTPFSFPMYAAGGYWAYDKKIVDMSNQELFHLQGPLNHELRNVICCIVALILHFVFDVSVVASIAFLAGCAIKRAMIAATSLDEPRNAALPIAQPVDSRNLRPAMLPS